MWPIHEKECELSLIMLVESVVDQYIRWVVLHTIKSLRRGHRSSSVTYRFPNWTVATDLFCLSLVFEFRFQFLGFKERLLLFCRYMPHHLQCTCLLVTKFCAVYRFPIPLLGRCASRRERSNQVFGSAAAGLSFIVAEHDVFWTMTSSLPSSTFSVTWRTTIYIFLHRIVFLLPFC